MEKEEKEDIFAFANMSIRYLWKDVQEITMVPCDNRNKVVKDRERSKNFL